jgi:hypothetical protein
VFLDITVVSLWYLTFTVHHSLISLSGFFYPGCPLLNITVLNLFFVVIEVYLLETWFLSESCWTRPRSSVSSWGPHSVSYDLDESSVYTSASPATVIIHVQFIISVNLLGNMYKQTFPLHKAQTKYVRPKILCPFPRRERILFVNCNILRYSFQTDMCFGFGGTICGGRGSTLIGEFSVHITWELVTFITKASRIQEYNSVR